MAQELTVKKSISIKANVEKVWEALTSSEYTRQYMFGCDVVTDWKTGSLILWKGLADGKEVVFVKGNIVNIQPGKLLQYTAIDPNSTPEDASSIYTTVTYELTPEGEHTLLKVTQGDFSKISDGEERYNHTINGWDFVLPKLKELLEK
jgi:uncharacterized protein YndB with AHSA1/START domain